MPRARQFRVIVSGDVLPEAARDEVLQALARLFHSTPEAMQRLLRGRPVALTRAYSQLDAEKICQAITTAGAACRMEEIADETEAADERDGDGDGAVGDGGDGDVGDGDVGDGGAGDGGVGDGDVGAVGDGPSRHPRSPHHRHPRSPLSGGGDGDVADADAVGDGDTTAANDDFAAGDGADFAAGDGDGDGDGDTADPIDEDDPFDEDDAIDEDDFADEFDDDDDLTPADDIRMRYAVLWNFVGVNIDYYRKAFAKFGDLDSPKFALSWNWAAFFAFFLWAAYRKLWHWAAAHLLGGLFLVQTFDPGPIYLAWALVWPALANYLYYRYALHRLFSEGGVLDDQIQFGDGLIDDRESLYAAANEVGGVSRAAVAVGVLFVLLSSMAFNHFITERVLERAGLSSAGELLPVAPGLVQRGDGASVEGNESLSPRGVRTLGTLNAIAAALKGAASSPALDDPELALAVVKSLVERRRFADGWGTAIVVRRDATGQVALVSAGPDREFDTADDLLRYIDLNEI